MTGEDIIKFIQDNHLEKFTFEKWNSYSTPYGGDDEYRLEPVDDCDFTVHRDKEIVEIDR